MTLLAREPLRAGRGGVLSLFVLCCAAIAAMAAAVVVLLRPHWTATSAADAPPLPVVVANVVFNVAGEAIRIPAQRRAGAQERIDLAYRWPELTPPDSHAVNAANRIFVTIETAQAMLPPAERLKTIYPRYVDTPPVSDPGGLTVAAFADGTPYQGEDVMYDADAPERFIVRCSRPRNDPTLAMCLHERAIGAAAVTFRFPRDFLSDWHAVESGIDRLIEHWRPSGKQG